MKFYKIIFLALSFSSLHAQNSPELKWLQSEYVKSTNVIGPTICKDAENNIFSISTQAHLNPFVGFILVKYDSYGNKLWERNYEGLQPHLYYGPAIDNLGNIYVSINYGGLLGSPIYTIMLKYSPNGELLWERSFEDWADNVTNVIAVDSMGLLFYAGGFSLTNIAQGYYVGCMDTANGDVIWQVNQDSLLSPYNIKLLEDRIVLFANGVLDTNSNTRSHVVQQIGFDGGILFTGSSGDTGFYGPDFNQMTNEGEVLIGNRGFGYNATKLSIEGEIVWHYEKDLIYDKAFARGLTSDDSLNVYVTGGWSQTETWIDFITTKISPNGDILWEKVYYLTNDSLGDVGENVLVDDKYVYSVGGGEIGDSARAVFLIYDRFNGDLLYDLKVVGNTEYNFGENAVLLDSGFAFCAVGHNYTAGSTEIHTGFYKFSAPVPTTEKAEKTDPFLLYPNPASEYIQVQISKRAIGENTAELYNLNGQLIQSQPFENTDRIRMETAQLPSGMYLMKVGNQALKFNISR